MSYNDKYNQYSPYNNNYNNDNYYNTENINQIEKDGNEHNNELDNSFDNLEYINIKNRIDPSILKQYLLFREFEKNEQMEEIKREKRKLKRSLSYFKKEKEKFNKEKVLFLQSRERVIRDNRNNEKKLLKFEKDLKNKYLKKKNELKEIKNMLKKEKINLENEKKKLKNIISSQDLNKENEFNNILNNQQNEINNKENHINKLNIQIKQKEKKINELNNKYNHLMKNLNVSENNISNTSNNDNDIINKESFPEDTLDDIKDEGSFPENSKENIFDDDYMKTPHDTFIEDDNNMENSKDYKKDIFENKNENEKDIVGENLPNNSNKYNNNNNLKKLENEDNLNLPLNWEINTLNNNLDLSKKKTMNYDFNFDSEDTDRNQEELIIKEYNSSLGLYAIDNPNYMNSIIQCFAHLPEITQSIVNIYNIEPSFKNLSNYKFLNAYRELLINLFFPEKVYNHNKKPYNPIKLRNLIYELNPIFKDNTYLTYVEFIGFIISKLHEELNIKKSENEINSNNENNIEKMDENEVYNDFLEKLNTQNNSQISKYLYGTIKSSLYCHKCQNTFYFFQPYSYLYFNLLNVLEYKINKYKKESQELNLFDCFEYYQRSEKMEGDKSFFCPNCKARNESTSIKNIYSSNTILIISFDYYKKNINDSKIYFDFEENINLRDYIQKKENNDNNEKKHEKFFLSGIVNSYEDNYGNINYKAFCKMSKNNVWYCYDNESVFPIDFKDIKKNGYPIALFYHKIFKN